MLLLTTADYCMHLQLDSAFSLLVNFSKSAFCLQCPVLMKLQNVVSLIYGILHFDNVKITILCLDYKESEQCHIDIQIKENFVSKMTYSIN